MKTDMRAAMKGSFAEAVVGKPAPGQFVRPLAPQIDAPVEALSKVFAYQSYLDTLLLHQALLVQPPNEAIVPSTREDLALSGYAVGLHPSSQTPVAIEFRIGNQPSSASPVVLKPGQIIRPFGMERGRSAFSGFRWGLPFGWLGGGLATLYVFQTPDAWVDWTGNPEVVFHRQRMLIVDAAGLPAAAPYNWPTSFPWRLARRDALNYVQGGDPSLALNPTRTLFRLRTASLAAANTMRVLFQTANEFDLDAASAAITTPVSFHDFVWPSYAAGGGAGDLATHYPVLQMVGPPNYLSCDDGGVVLLDLTGDLVGLYVDVVRYGYL